MGMSEGPGSGSNLGSKCGEGLTTNSTGAVASPAALDAMHVNFPESYKYLKKRKGRKVYKVFAFMGIQPHVAKYCITKTNISLLAFTDEIKCLRKIILAILSSFYLSFFLNANTKLQFWL